jgi:hypothetical protein
MILLEIIMKPIKKLLQKTQFKKIKSIFLSKLKHHY